MQVYSKWQVVGATEAQLVLISMNLSCIQVIQVFHFVFDGQPKVDIFWGDPSQLLHRATGRQSCLHHLPLPAVALLQALVEGFCQTSLHSHAM